MMRKGEFVAYNKFETVVIDYADEKGLKVIASKGITDEKTAKHAMIGIDRFRRDLELNLHKFGKIDFTDSPVALVVCLKSFKRSAAFWHRTLTELMK